MIAKLGKHRPEIAASCYVAPNATLVGKVTLQAGSSVWFGAVLRGDIEPITVGENSNIQDNSVLHTDHGSPLVVGNHVTVGHSCVLHGCSVGDGSLIGIGAIVLSGAVIGKNCLIGAGSLVTERKVIPDGSLVIGSPAKVIRSLTPEEIAGIGDNTERYVENARRYREELGVEN